MCTEIKILCFVLSVFGSINSISNNSYNDTMRKKCKSMWPELNKTRVQVVSFSEAKEWLRCVFLITSPTWLSCLPRLLLSHRAWPRRNPLTFLLSDSTRVPSCSAAPHTQVHDPVRRIQPHPLTPSTCGSGPCQNMCEPLLIMLLYALTWEGKHTQVFLHLKTTKPFHADLQLNFDFSCNF